MGYDELKSQLDMLQSNINRLFLTRDIDELDRMYEYAVKRLHAIYEGNRERLECGLLVGDVGTRIAYERSE